MEARFPRQYPLVNCGFSGRTSSEGLDRLGEFVLPHLPGILLVQFGVNDAYVHLWQKISRVSLNEYARSLSEIARIARERDSLQIIVITHPLRNKNRNNQGNGLSQAENVAPYVAAARRLAQEEKVACIDLPFNAEKRGIPAELITSGDAVHLAPGGHQFLADAMFEGLQEVLLRQETL